MKAHIKRVLSFMLIAIVVISIATPAFAADQSSISENGITIQTSLIDGSLQKGQKKTFDVWARDSSGAKIPCTAILNGQAVKVNWNDADKTSFTLAFTTEGVNTVVVTASSNGETATAIFHITYKKAEKGEIIGYASWCVEAFTIGRGYLIEPIKVPIREGENSAAALVGLETQVNSYSNNIPSTDSIIGRSGLNFKATGKVSSGFYLSAITSGTQKLNMPSDISGQIPSVLKDVMTQKHHRIKDGRKPDNLGEFDYAQGSGWMYSVNNFFPNVGFSDTYLSDGDVVRVQFTIWYGSDIGGSSAMGDSSNSFYTTSNKSKLTDLVAQINSGEKEKLLNNPSIHAAYDNAYKVLQQVDANQPTVDSAYNTLYGAMNQAQVPTNPTNPTNPVIPSNPAIPSNPMTNPTNSTNSTSTDFNPVSAKDKVTNITIDAPAGVLPTNTQVSVSPVTNHALAIYQLAETALNKVAEKFTAYQITLESGNTVIEPNGKVKVSLPIPEGYDPARLAVARILDDGTTKLYDVTVRGDTLSFETDHFSLYAVLEKTSASSSATLSKTSTISASSGKTNFNSEANPNTGDNVPVYAIFFVASISFLSILYFVIRQSKDAKRMEQSEKSSK